MDWQKWKTEWFWQQINRKARDKYYAWRTLGYITKFLSEETEARDNVREDDHMDADCYLSDSDLEADGDEATSDTTNNNSFDGDDAGSESDDNSVADTNMDSFNDIAGVSVDRFAVNEGTANNECNVRQCILAEVVKQSRGRIAVCQFTYHRAQLRCGHHQPCYHCTLGFSYSPAL